MRDREQLKQVASEFDKRANTHSGLGMVLIVFDEIERVQRPTHMAIVIKGVKAMDAVRMMREQADAIERAERGEERSRIITPGGPVILKSSKH